MPNHPGKYVVVVRIQEDPTAPIYMGMRAAANNWGERVSIKANGKIYTRGYMFFFDRWLYEIVKITLSAMPGILWHGNVNNVGYEHPV